MIYLVYTTLRKISFFLAAVILFSGGGEAFSQEEALFDYKREGEYFLRVYQDIGDDTSGEDSQAIDARVQLDNTLKLNGWDAFLNINAEARFEAFIGDDTEKDVDLLLREAYLEIYRQRFRLSVGRQVVTWGKLDDVDIIDRISPQDYRWFLLLPRQRRKDPVFMLKLDYYGENYDIEGVVLPFFEPSYLKYFGSDWALFGHLKEAIEGGNYSAATKNTIRNIDVVEKDKPAKRVFKNTQLGLRFRSRIKDVDYSLYYMYIYNRIPALREKTAKGNTLKKFLYLPATNNLNQLVAANPNNNDLTLEREHERVQVIGFDAETVLAQLGLRGEAGLLLDMPYLRSDFSYVRKDTFSLGLGVDHTTSGNAYYNFQFIEDFIFDYESLFYNEEYSYRFTNTLRKDFLRGRVIFNIDSSYSPSYRDWMVNPQLTYKFNNGLGISLGGFVFEGAPTTIFGRYTDKDLLYLETTYKF